MTDQEKSLGTRSVARRVLDSVAVVCFLAVTAAPTVDLWVRPDRVRNPKPFELRMPARKPPPPASTSDLMKYPANYEAYFKDSFGLRDRLLRWNSVVKVFGFGVSPTPEVYFGKEGWIFYKGGRTQENHRGAYPFAPDALRAWGAALERKRALLESMGIRYLYAIAPDKETVYAELLPDWMRPLGPTRREQFVEFMRREQPRVEILDLNEALLEAKRAGAREDWLYGPLGTHWTGRGTLVALRALLERLDRIAGGFSPSELDLFQHVDLAGLGDSWTQRMYIGDLLKQRHDAWKSPETRWTVIDEGTFMAGTVRRTQIVDSSRPRVVLMHDSFASELQMGLAEQCSRLECHWTPLIAISDLERSRPDVLVDFFVERTLNYLDPHSLIPSEEPPWPDRFEKSTRTLLSLDKTLKNWGVSPVHGAQVGPAVSVPKPRLPVTMSAATDRLGLPALTPVPGETPLLHLAIDSAHDTELVLFYRPPGEPSFDADRSYVVPLRQGINNLYLPLDREERRVELQMKPGDYVGAYLLREFEIRSVPKF